MSFLRSFLAALLDECDIRACQKCGSLTSNSVTWYLRDTSVTRCASCLSDRVRELEEAAEKKGKNK